MLISIVIPVYNVEHLIARCIDSLLNQLYKDFEVLIVDDCSPDNSIDVAKELINGDKRFSFLKHERNRGLMQARKTGYLNASGDFIMFCDSDDSLPHNCLELFKNQISRTSVDMIVGNHIKLYAKGNTEVSNNSIIAGNPPNNLFLSVLKGTLSHSLWAKIFRRELLLASHIETLEDFTYGEDAMLLYQLIPSIVSFEIIDDIVYNYYVNEGSSTKSEISEKSLDSILKLQVLRHNLSIQNPDIQKDFQRKIVQVVFSLFMTYNDNNLLRIKIKESALNEYITIKSIFKYLSFTKAIFLFILLSLNNKIKNNLTKYVANRRA